MCIVFISTFNTFTPTSLICIISDMKKCKCGLCNDCPVVYRGKQLDYASGHNKTAWYIKRYVELYGNPKCKVCGSPSGFKRKIPNRFCSHRCSGMVNGFSKPSTQTTILNSVRDKYGVNNVSQLPDVREKISASKRGKTFELTPEWKQHIGEGSKRKWKDPDYRKRTSLGIKKSLNTPEQKKKRSSLMKDRWSGKDGRYDLLNKLLNGLKNRLSKLHRLRKIELELESKGFVSEQRVGRYLVDELNEPKKLIIEINGDYVHANPKIHNPDDIIYLPGNSYTAAEKWESDAIKRKNLETMGYRVITIWESDSLEDAKVQCS